METLHKWSLDRENRKALTGIYYSVLISEEVDRLDRLGFFFLSARHDGSNAGLPV